MSHPAITMTNGVLAVLSAENVPIIVCDNSYLPVGQVVPYESASLSAERARLQIAAPRAKMQLIWEKLISAKIKNQAFVLAEQGYSERADYLIKLCRSFKDVDSSESHAARMYFEALFDSGFNRRDDGFSENRVLNYAYALLRSRVVRTICATGLHPTFGIKHHNKYNAFALADDLMEPFRPIYDMKALELISLGLVELEPCTKKELIEFA
ncbi:type II CRISPR-associated endonuclease Cas1, partial [bacterium]|nr:type II CRISPR-associated endonuclease Cas1 [bacterium]